MSAFHNDSKEIHRATARARYGHAAAYLGCVGRVSRRRMRMYLKHDGFPEALIADALLSMGYPEPVQAKKGGAN